jgi:hypothetical protein
VSARQDIAVRERVISALGGSLPEDLKLEWDHDMLVARGAMAQSQLTLLKQEAIRLASLAVVDFSEVTAIPEKLDPVRLLEAMDVPFVTGTLQFEASTPGLIKQLLEQIQKVDASSAHERKYRLRAWPITGEKVEGNQAMQLTRLTLVQQQIKALGYPFERFSTSITEAESLSGRRGVWVEVLPEAEGLRTKD